MNQDARQPYLPRRPENSLVLPESVKLPQSITKKDYFRSATATMIDDMIPLLDRLKAANIRRMCDVGCGFGGVTRYIADYLGVEEVVGLDLDSDVLEDVKEQRLVFHLVDLNSERIPYPDGHFDLVTSFGVLEHLVSFDNAITEMHRTLKKGGLLLVNVPNLASWIQRVGFLFGFQPRDVEVSTKTVPGRLWFYDDQPFGHIHSLTLRAMLEYLEHSGFSINVAKGARPIKENAKWNTLARAADRILSKRASLARRLNIIAEKM
jgi:SAM-dependent methyltransferase